MAGRLTVSSVRPFHNPVRIRFGHGALEDLAVTDGLFCALDHVQMGVHGDTVAAELGVGRH